MQPGNTNLQAADIFSLGASIYEVARRKALPRNGEEWEQLRRGPLPPVPGMSAQLLRLLSRMMHPDPAQRGTAATLLQEHGIVQGATVAELGAMKNMLEETRTALAVAMRALVETLDRQASSAAGQASPQRTRKYSVFEGSAQLSGAGNPEAAELRSPEVARALQRALPDSAVQVMRSLVSREPSCSPCSPAEATRPSSAAGERQPERPATPGTAPLWAAMLADVWRQASTQLGADMPHLSARSATVVHLTTADNLSPRANTADTLASSIATLHAPAPTYRAAYDDDSASMSDCEASYAHRMSSIPAPGRGVTSAHSSPLASSPGTQGPQVFTSAGIGSCFGRMPSTCLSSTMDSSTAGPWSAAGVSSRLAEQNLSLQLPVESRSELGSSAGFDIRASSASGYATPQAQIRVDGLPSAISTVAQRAALPERWQATTPMPPMEGDVHDHMRWWASPPSAK